MESNFAALKLWYCVKRKHRPLLNETRKILVLLKGNHAWFECLR